MKVRIKSDIDFNPRGLHENSGVNQWLDETLVAVQQLHTARRGGWCVVELPARSTTLHEARGNGHKMRFDAEGQAEAWISRNYPATVVIVRPEDITEEIERRNGAMQQ